MLLLSLIVSMVGAGICTAVQAELSAEVLIEV
jgi:hypothetical protein